HRRGRPRHAQIAREASPRERRQGRQGRQALGAHTVRARNPGRPGRCGVTGRSLAVQSGLAALGLITVYATWQREPERAPGAVTVIDASKSDVTKVHFEDEPLSVERTRAPSGDGVWRHLVTKPKAETRPDPKAPPKPEAKPAPTPPPR